MATWQKWSCNSLIHLIILLPCRNSNNFSSTFNTAIWYIERSSAFQRETGYVFSTFFFPYYSISCSLNRVQCIEVTLTWRWSLWNSRCEHIEPGHWWTIWWMYHSHGILTKTWKGSLKVQCLNGRQCQQLLLSTSFQSCRTNGVTVAIFKSPLKNNSGQMHLSGWNNLTLSSTG